MNTSRILEEKTIWEFYETEHEKYKYRERIQRFLIPILQVFKPCNIIEIGAGNGAGALLLHELGWDVHAIDPFFKEDIQKIYPFFYKGSGSRFHLEIILLNYPFHWK